MYVRDPRISVSAFLPNSPRALASFRSAFDFDFAFAFDFDLAFAFDFGLDQIDPATYQFSTIDFTACPTTTLLDPS